MRSFLSARTTSAAATGLAMLIAAGGGYAIAKGGSNTVKACAQKGTHLLYTGKCHKHDQRLTWNKVGPRGNTGPQGPGATKLVYDSTGSAAAPLTPIGKMGPWTVSGGCAQPSAGTTAANLYLTGPNGRLDGYAVFGSSVAAGSGSFSAQSNSPVASPPVTSSSSTTSTDTLHALWLPASGTSVETLITIAATGSSNTCHASIAITPTG